MNITLWVIQGLAALLYAASGVMKVFMFDKIREGVRSFDAYPRKVWTAIGILELICVPVLILPGLLHWHPSFTPVAATLLAVESIVFIAAHARYREIPPIILSAALGLLMAFIAYGRLFLSPLI